MVRYEYLDGNLNWKAVKADKPIDKCINCGRYRVVTGAGTICNLSNRNIGQHHYFVKKPDDFPLIERGDE